MGETLNSPLVSVIIPVYNRETLIGRALLSLLGQTYAPVELIVVDDGSTDGSLQRIRELLPRFPLCKLLALAHQGAVGALNRGLAEASGKYLGFLDSDDEYLSEYLERRVSFLEANPLIDLIHSNAELVGDPDDLLVPDRKDPRRLIHLNDCLIGATLFGKRELFLNLNGFREQAFYDSDLLDRAGARYRILRLDLPDYRYYRNVPDSMMTRMKQQAMPHAGDQQLNTSPS